MGTGQAKRVFLALAAIASVTVATACGEAKIKQPDKEDLVSDATVEISPAPKSDDVPVAAEIAPGLKGGDLVEMKVETEAGDAVKGQLRKDGSSWVPAKPLAYSAQYTTSVTAIDDHRRTVTKKSTFTTMKKPSEQLEPMLANEDGATYGKAMPVAVDFPTGFEIPEKQRAAVEKRLFVDSEPKQEGVWHWFTGGRLQYRPQEFWEPGTKITVRLGLKGLKLKGDTFGARDMNAKFTIDKTDREVTISNEKKQLVASKDGKSVKKMPVSLGKPGYESYSGTMSIMNRLPNTIFDTTNEPGCNGKEGGSDCYRTKVTHAERLTWTGQFIHAAPWSVWAQGSQNVSHGCVNVSAGDAQWVYDFVKVGDPVTVSGTGVDLPAGDGYTAYDLNWKDFRAGSYLEQQSTS